MKQQRRFLRWFSLAVLLALLAGACSSSDDDDATSTTGADSGDEADDALEPISVTFLPSTETLGVLPFLQALAKDYFTEEGIDLNYQAVLSNAAQVVQTVATGGADMAHSGTSGLLSAVATDIDVVSAGYIGSVTLAIVLTNETIEELEADGVTADSPIEDKVAALEGRTLAAAAAGSYADLIFRQTLQEYDLRPDQDVTIQPIADSTAIATAAREGGLDGYIASPPVIQLAEAEGWGEVWISYADGDVPAFAGIPQFDLVTTRGYAEENEEAVVRMLKAIDRGLQDINEDPESVRTTVKERFYPDLDAEIYDAAFDFVLPAFADGLQPSQERFDQALGVFNAGRPEPATFTFDDFYVLEPLEAAFG